MTQLKNEVKKLRKNGKTYSEIQRILGVTIPKSTLSYWCSTIKLSEKQKKKIAATIQKSLENARKKALATNRKKRIDYLNQLRMRVEGLSKKIKNPDVAKIALAMLYLGEGSKSTKGALMFGNSDAATVGLFLKLLRYCYNINEKKFRCTVQCRADQNTKKLEVFWSKITNIPPQQFYKTRIDKRTLGKPSKKPDYKGVCRIDYLSSETHNELKIIAQVIG